MKVLLSSFTAGELSPKLLGRSDLPGITKGCRYLRNFLPRMTGGAFRRPGSLYQWTAKSSSRVPCLLPFNFSATDAMVLEMGHLTLRFGQDGALVGAPYELAALWEEDELFDHRYVQVNDIVFLAHEARSPYVLTRLAAGSWTLETLNDIIEDADSEDGFPWPPMLDENISATTMAMNVLTVGEEVPAGSFVVGVQYEITVVGTTDFTLIGASANTLTVIFTATGAGSGTGFAATTGRGKLTATAATFVAGHVGAFFEIAHRRDTSSDELKIPVYPPATVAMCMTVVPTAEETFSINGITYTWKAAPSGPYHVLIGADVAASRVNAQNAINATSISGFGAGTAPHPDVVATNDDNTAPTPTATGTLTGNGRNTLCPSGTNVQVIINGIKYRFEENNLGTLQDGATYNVKKGATEEESLQNLVKAINLTGVQGTHYGNHPTVAHPDVTAAMSGINKVLITAKTAGAGGNAITTTVNDSANSTEPLTWASATLVGGSASPLVKLRVTAREAGAAGNNITVADTMTTDFWETSTLKGGVDIGSDDAPFVSDGIKILGSYKVWSYGTWKAEAVLLERRLQEGDAWEVIRQWTGNNDRNVAETGIAEYQQTLRFRVIGGVGTASADVDIPRFVIEADDAKIYGLVRIASITSTTVAVADLVQDVYSTDATPLWSEGAWSDLRGYPRAVALHEQRLIFMGTTHQPQTLWASATGDFYNFRRGVNDADSFTQQIAANETSPIMWGVSLGDGIVIGKQSQEWLGVSSDGASPMTPTNFQAKFQGAYGSASVQPVIVGSHVVFVQDGGRAAMAFQYAWDEQAFFAVDLAELADHFTKGRIKQMAYQRKPQSIIWIVTEDSKLYSLSYQREKEQTAWAYHQINAAVESVCCINADAGLDDVYIAVRRTVNSATVRYIEKLDTATMLNVDDDDVDDETVRGLLTYLDCSKHGYDAVAKTAWTGFDHLSGEIVSVMADGIPHADVLVTAGAITLTRAANYVCVGIDYSDLSLLTPFKIDTGLQDGTSVGRKVKVSQLAVQLYNTSAAEYSDSWTGRTWYPMKIHFPTVASSAIQPAATKTVILPCNPGYNDEIQTTIRPVHGEPCNILSLAPSFIITGS
jgi:hypothetical protein